jgi:transposase InsO family protein
LKELKICPNGYYNYKKHRKNAKKKIKASTLKKIKELYHESGGKPGYRMMTAMLARKGIHLSEQTVHLYMNVELGLRSVTRKRKYRYYKEATPYSVFENLLNRDFSAKRRNTRWCVDFTYLYLANRNKRYNCSIIDLYDRRVVASVTGKRINTKLAVETLTKAIKACGGETGMILHSDRGSQFTSKEFAEFCKEHGVTQSMSRPGCPYDNAPMERYFNTLKSELIYLKTFDIETKLYEEVAAYAFGWYNNLRPHSYNGGIPPAKVA